MTIGGGRAVRAFRHRNYRLFFAGQLTSLVGTWMQEVAQSWLVLQLTGDPFWLGVVAAAQFLPVLAFGLFAGIVADALPKRETLIVTQVAMMAFAATLAILTLTGLVQVWMIVLLAFLLGCTNAVDMPVRQAFAVEIVGREDVGNAIVLNSAMFNTARIIGPAVAGIAIATLGIGIAFVVNAISYLAVIGGLFAMSVDELANPVRIARPHSTAELADQLREGVGYVRQTKPVLVAVVVVGLVSTFGMNFTVVMPALARDVLHQDAAGYGFLMAASGVGSLAALAWMAASSSIARPSWIVLGAIVLGAAEVALALSGSYLLSVALMLVVGAGGITMAATANTTIQLTVPDRLRGRVLSVYTTVFAGSTPVGGLITGSIASVLGIAIAVGIGGALSLAVGLLGLVWVRRGPQPVGASAPAPGLGRTPAHPR